MSRWTRWRIRLLHSAPCRYGHVLLAATGWRLSRSPWRQRNSHPRPAGRGAHSGVERLRAFDPAAVEARTDRLRRQVRLLPSPEREGRTGFCRTGSDPVRARAAGRERPADRRPPAGRPPTPPIALTPPEVSDVATFLHREITYAAERTNYQLQYVMTGNASAGETYFNGAGGCNQCHSPTGDLKGIGSRNDGPGSRRSSPSERSERRSRTRRRGVRPVANRTQSHGDAASGETFSGVLVRLTDFDVTIRDDAGQAAFLAAQRQHAEGAGHRSAAGTHRPVAEIHGRGYSRPRRRLRRRARHRPAADHPDDAQRLAQRESAALRGRACTR